MSTVFKPTASHELVWNFNNRDENLEEGLYLVIDGMQYKLAYYFKSGTIISKETATNSPVSKCIVAETDGFYQNTRDGMRTLGFILAYAKLPDASEITDLCVERSHLE